MKASLSTYLSLSVVAISIAVLTGWAIDSQILKSVLPGFITMKANTAICFLLLAAACLAQRRERRTVGRIAVTTFFAGSTLAIALVTMYQYLFDKNLGIDELFFRDPEGAVGQFPPGRLAPITAINFIFLSGSLLLANLPRRPH